jgi:hypothetical protein
MHASCAPRYHTDNVSRCGTCAAAAADMLGSMNPAMIEGMLTSLQAMDDSSLKEVGAWTAWWLSGWREQ